MPIPPRPIPTPSHHRRRAARPSPRLPSSAGTGAGGRESAFIAESRAEMALLPRRSVGSTPNSLRGVRLMHVNYIGGSSAPSSRPNSPAASPGSGPSSPVPATPSTVDVPLASLIKGGGGRAPRGGAAAQLGFDVVPRGPEVVALGDGLTVEAPVPTAPQPVDTPRRSSFWNWASPSATPASSFSKLAAGSTASPTASSSLPDGTRAPAAVVPSTPALVPSLPVDDEDDDDWEHVHAVEDDHIVGELELDADELAVGDAGGASGGKAAMAPGAYATVTARVRPGN